MKALLCHPAVTLLIGWACGLFVGAAPVAPEFAGIVGLVIALILWAVASSIMAAHDRRKGGR